MVDDATLQEARNLYNEGKLEPAGKLIGLEPVAKKYGHAFDEEPEAYARRLRASLGLPEETEAAQAGVTAPHTESAPAPPVAPQEAELELEDVPEPEDEDDDSPHRRGRRRRT